MTIRSKIRNQLKITCADIDLTTLTNIEFFVKQLGFFRYYTPTVLSSTEMAVVIPYQDAMDLTKGTVDLQFAFKDAEGNPDASEIVTTNVKDLLKEVGYDPV